METLLESDLLETASDLLWAPWKGAWLGTSMANLKENRSENWSALGSLAQTTREREQKLVEQIIDATSFKNKSSVGTN